MINNINEFLNLINEEILNDYNIKLSGVKSEEANVLAFFNTQDKQIYVNKHNKYVFNDYFMFITTMQHENVHLINNMLGIEDVDIDKNGKQWHNEFFKMKMEEEYCLKVCNEYGNIDFNDKDNKEIFADLINESIRKKKMFQEIQEYYLKYIYEELPQNTGSDSKNGGDKKVDYPDKDDKKEDKKEGKKEDGKNSSKKLGDDDSYEPVEEDEDTSKIKKGESYDEDEEDEYEFEEERGVEL